MVTHPGEGMKEVKLPPSRKLSHRQVFGEFWNLRRQQNWGGKKKKNSNTSNMPNCNCKWRSNPEACVCHQHVGAGQGGVVCIISA